MRNVKTGRNRTGLLAAVAGGAVLAMAPGAMAQYTSDFEALAPGIVTGQDGYYLPNTTSADYTVETYPTCPGACNFDTSTGPGTCDIFDFLGFQNLFVAADPCACDLDTSTGVGVCDIFDFLGFQNGFVAGETGFPVNPTGGNQYIKGVGPAGGVFARAQRDITWPTGVVTMSYDVLCDTTATPGSNNLGSFSIQAWPTSASLIHLFRWAAGGPDWEVATIAYNAVGTQVTAAPDPAFTGLKTNKWYRLSLTVDFATNLITETSITDIDAGTTTTIPVVDLYLGAGTVPNPHPTGFRFFAGGGVPGNSVCWDNATIN
jgi:hypothetical protein